MVTCPISHRTAPTGMNKGNFKASSNAEMFTKKSCAFETSIAETLRLNELNRKESGMSQKRQASG